MNILDKVFIIIIIVLLFSIKERYESYCDVCVTSIPLYFIYIKKKQITS